MGVFTRGRKLWIRFADVDGTWRSASTGYLVGDEARAREVLSEVETRVAAQRGAALATEDAGGQALRAYARDWLSKREAETTCDDRGRIENHIIPALGHLRLAEIRPKHVRDFVAALGKKRRLGNVRKDGSRVETDELLAPRTVRHIYATLRVMLNDAVADELIASSPCALKTGDLPQKRDKDPTWRRTAVFTRDEVETIISAPADAIPEDRRTLYRIMFLGAMRFGEVAALTWRDYDAECSPLGKIVVEKSYSTKTRRVKSTKTDNPREMPVHPVLAHALAEWKLGGFQRLTGRAPRPEDLIVPSRRGAPRNVNHMLRRFHEDLERVGLRSRRQHDARRTFISIARADGARPDVLRWATNGPTGDITDQYTTLPWDTLCAEVAKARIALLAGEVIALPIAVVAGADRPVTPLVTASQVAVTSGEKSRSGRDSNPRPPA
jgi:integrase